MALRGIVELGEAQAFFGQPINPRCLDFTPVTSKIGETEVVYHHEENVGRVFRSGCHWGEAEEEYEQSRQHCFNMRSRTASFKCNQAGRLVRAHANADWVPCLILTA